MSDKLFIRDILEQISRLNPQLPTNIIRIETGSFQDLTRVHLLDERQDDEESVNESLVVLKRQRQSLENEIKQLETKARDQRAAQAQEQLAHSTKMALLTERLRKIREQTRQRELPLP